MKNKWVFIAFFLLFMTFASFVVASVLSLFGGEGGVGAAHGNVARIPINGVILSGESQSYLTEPVAPAKELIDFIKKADARPELRAIVLDISSPGGSAVASQMVADAVANANKTVYAFIREQGTSGAYWVASASDKIIAHELSATGSIGVISSYLEFSGLLQDYNVTYQRLVAGKYKDIGTPFRKLTPEEEQILQKKLDVIHDAFITAVAENRHLPKEKVTALATGMFYLGKEAKEMGLVDELGDEESVTALLKKDLQLDDVQYVDYKKQKTFFDILERLATGFGFWVGRGIATPRTESITITT